MWVIKEEGMKVPAKIWADQNTLETEALAQIKNAASLPFAYSHVALMPDGHVGIGAPIGGVLATEGVVIPNFVGVDIGCGMGYIQTDIKLEEIEKLEHNGSSLIHTIIWDFARNIPTGFGHRKIPLPLSEELYNMTPVVQYDKWEKELYGKIFPSIECQIGTLGGGNHFIEMQVDEEGYIGFMLHSGSRNVGAQIAKVFDDRAKELNEKWHSSVPAGWKLAFLPLDTEDGKKYMAWMNFALQFAKENRAMMMKVVKETFERWVTKLLPGRSIAYTFEVNAHHNYAALENHFGKNVVVHRKGAIRVHDGELGIIPGSMSTGSYIVKGKGEAESFMSASHGAGRKMGRKAAMKAFTRADVEAGLKTAGITLAKNDMEDVAEECGGAYKDIESVITLEGDLVTPIKKLRPLAVLKG